MKLSNLLVLFVSYVFDWLFTKSLPPFCCVVPLSGETSSYSFTPRFPRGDIIEHVSDSMMWRTIITALYLNIYVFLPVFMACINIWVCIWDVTRRYGVDDYSISQDKQKILTQLMIYNSTIDNSDTSLTEMVVNINHFNMFRFCTSCWNGVMTMLLCISMYIPASVPMTVRLFMYVCRRYMLGYMSCHVSGSMFYSLPMIHNMTGYNSSYNGYASALTYL